uniref:Anthranilate phosphoribosyltransferase n=1 Tax=Moniliophthora roreri TaxID=221103 RepID=A0A0W0F6H8_MONRR
MTATFTAGSFKPLLKTLVEKPEYFTSDDLKIALDHVFTPGTLPPEHIGAFLTALHLQRVERRPESLAAAASVLRSRSLKAKHGSRASTSASGSADLLEAMDCLFNPPNPDIHNPIPKMPFWFILAPHYHPALAYLAPFRKALPFRTMFNVLGPLINPAFPQGMVLGVTEPELGAPFAKSLRDGGVERALVVCGYERMDEISCAGPSYAWELKDGVITELTLTPKVFGLQAHPLTSVAGGNPEENARTFKTLLTSGNDLPKEMKPFLDFVLMNTSALLVVAGIAKDYKEGVKLGLESVTSGKAWEALQTFKNFGRNEAEANGRK